MKTLTKRFAAYQEVYTKGKYIRFSKSQIKIMFVGKFFRFETSQDVISDALQHPLVQWVNSDYQEPVDITFYHEFDRQLTPDSFLLTVSSNREIHVKTKNRRGFRYAMEAVNLLFELKGQEVVCPEIEIAHHVSFSMRGVIEGFYGIPWQHSDRLDLLHYLGNNKMNTFMYAPKDDAYQRNRWRELYPQDKLERFTELLEVAETEMINFYYMISPGNDIDYTEKAEMKVLTTKLQQMIDIGVRHFGLLLDDIDYILKGKAKRKFGTSALAHAYIIKEVDDFLATELADYSLVACPTEYDNHHDSLYLEQLNKALPQHIPLFWTGPSTLASQISTTNIKTMAASYQRPIVIWDNIPVNDYQKDYELLFLSPYENRSPHLQEKQYQVVGIVSNPMAQWELSKLTVHNMSQYLWDSSRFTLETAWQTTLESYAGSGFSEALGVFADFNPNKYTREVMPVDYLKLIEEKNVVAITQELTKLAEASRLLKELPNEAFQKNIGPWLIRVEKDLNLWELIQTADKKAAGEAHRQLAEYPYRIGTDLVAGYMNYWGSLKED